MRLQAIGLVESLAFMERVLPVESREGVLKNFNHVSIDGNTSYMKHVTTILNATQNESVAQQ
jgi:hypothetical protein